jgi:hypothetical protein
MEIHMETISLARKQWAEVSHELESVRIGPTPRGLRGRVQRLLADTPAMREETLSLVLDPSAASTVWWILRRAQRRTAETPDGGERQCGGADAERVVRMPQRGSRYRLEHRDAPITTILGYLNGPYASQAELSEHAARLIADGAWGELVLVDVRAGTDVARRRLQSRP